MQPRNRAFLFFGFIWAIETTVSRNLRDKIKLARNFLARFTRGRNLKTVVDSYHLSLSGLWKVCKLPILTCHAQLA